MCPPTPRATPIAAAQTAPTAERRFLPVPLQVGEWKSKCDAIEKRESERRDADAKKHKEEVSYLENHAKQLKQQLEAFMAPAKKAAGKEAAKEPAAAS